VWIPLSNPKSACKKTREVTSDDAKVVVMERMTHEDIWNKTTKYEKSKTGVDHENTVSEARDSPIPHTCKFIDIVSFIERSSNFQ
jgi:hypothetical protein